MASHWCLSFIVSKHSELGVGID